jgi:acyl carrier protein
MKNGRYGQVVSELVKILEDMTQDWDMEFEGGISAETKLIGELSFESIEVVQLMVMIEEHFKLETFNSEELLMEDGRYVDELTVGQIARFLTERAGV